MDEDGNQYTVGILSGKVLEVGEEAEQRARLWSWLGPLLGVVAGIIIAGFVGLGFVLLRAKKNDSAHVAPMVPMSYAASISAAPTVRERSSSVMRSSRRSMATTRSRPQIRRADLHKCELCPNAYPTAADLQQHIALRH